MEPIAPDEGAIDRRAARSRVALKRALMSLTLEHGYDAVTIEQLCRKAEVSRSTFYAHFTGKDDLKRSGLNQLRRQLHEVQAATQRDPARANDRLSFGRALFEHARAHRELFCALAGGAGATVAVDSIRTIVAELVRKELPPHSVEPGSRELTAQFIAGAYITVLLAWLHEGAQQPLEQVEGQCRRLALHGLTGASRP